MNKRRIYKVVPTFELKVWNEEKMVYEKVFEKASFLKEDDKHLLIGQSAKRSTLYAKTDNGLLQGPSMFNQAEYLGGAFIYSKGREWFLLFPKTEDLLPLGRDAKYCFHLGIWVIEAYDAERQDNVVFLYFPKTQVCQMYVDTYYLLHKNGVLLRKGHEHVLVKETQAAFNVGRYNKEFNFFWSYSDGEYIVSRFNSENRLVRKRYVDLAMANCFVGHFEERLCGMKCRVAWNSDGSFDIVAPFDQGMTNVYVSDKESRGHKPYLHKVILGWRYDSGGSFNKAFEGEVYLHWRNLIVVKHNGLFVLYHVSRYGSLTEISSSEVCSQERYNFFGLIFRLNYPCVDSWGARGIALAKEHVWQWDAKSSEGNDDESCQPSQKRWKKWFSW